MGSRCRPNAELRALLAEGGWTGHQFAVMVNRAGAEAGIRLGYDRTSVSHWLAGVHPRQQARAPIAEALSRGLGRPVTAAEAGLGPAAGPAREDPAADPAAELATLPGQQAAGARPYRTRQLAGLTWPPPQPPRPRHQPRPPIPPLPSQPGEATRRPLLAPAGVIETAESLARLFSASDRAFGGGSARAALAGYLANDIAPRLREPGRPAERGRLHAVAAQLSYLCGFMCYDDEVHGLGQRYYLAALSLAAEAGDRTGYAVTLRAMSVQAQSLGHQRQALHLAEAAVDAGKAADPLRQAFLHGNLAAARAADGDRGRALDSLTAAERFLSGATSASAPFTGTYHPASLSHQEAEVRALLGDRAAAAMALARSIRYRPAGERRARAVTLARLAEIQFATGHLDQAVSTWHRFLDEYPHLASGRASTALRTMRAMLRPHARHPAVAGLLIRAVAQRPPAPPR
ncbi:MAG TPA: hypothetical protein VH478_17790 [Trebonia sp.]|jgi:tetratricopeptide (TPR) repeat protein|nr:hypothetical protein [Trebonia sp.]